MNLKFSGRGLAFLYPFKATDDIRCYMSGVYFEPLPADAGGGVLGAATNGHAMGVWVDRDAVCDRPVIARVSPALAAACRRSSHWLENIDGRLTAMNYREDAEIGFEAFVQPNGRPLALKKMASVEDWEVEGKFPDVSRVVRARADYTEGVTGAVSSVYLGLVDRALRAAHTGSGRRGYGYNELVLRQVDSSSSILIVSPPTPEALAIVMPMRGDDCLGAPWLDAWQRHTGRQHKIAATPLTAMPSDGAPPPEFQPQRIVRGKVRAA